MKGYLYVQSMAEFERERRLVNYDESELLAIPSSYEGRGCFPITHAIKRGDFLNLSAELGEVRIEARFNTKVNVPEGDNGTCEIRGGPFTGIGVFRTIRRVHRPEIKDFFICHSSSGDGKHFLRWQIGVNDFVDADMFPDEK